MREITASTPRRNIQIGGVILSAPTPFEAGDVLNENEAASLNQTYLENVGNNYRAAITKAKKLAILNKTEATAEELKSVTDEQLKVFDTRLEDADFAASFAASVQPGLDQVVSEYKMGVRRSSSVEVVDPVTREARAIAKTRLKAALQKKGIKLNTVSTDWYDREISKLLDKESPKMAGDRNITAEIWAGAEDVIKARREAAGESLDELDLDGVEKEEDEAEASDEPTTDTQA